MIGRLPGGVGLLELARYDGSIPLSSTTGTKGVEIIGATRSKRMEVPPTEPVTERLAFPEANLFQLRSGEGVRITYGILRAGGEFLNDQDRQPTLSFSGRDGEIDPLESGIGKVLIVELNREEANADADLITLTLLLARINLEDQREVFDSLSIETTHLTGFRPRPAEGSQQLYEVLSLKGTASQVG